VYRLSACFLFLFVFFGIAEARLAAFSPRRSAVRALERSLPRKPSRLACSIMPSLPRFVKSLHSRPKGIKKEQVSFSTYLFCDGSGGEI
jgi:hypothetical protein